MRVMMMTEMSQVLGLMDSEIQTKTSSGVRVEEAKAHAPSRRVFLNAST
jgi:hypothetical protein